MKTANYRRVKIRGIILYVFICIYIYPQDQVLFDHITTKEGLSSQKVVDIVQDKLGFIWFATQNGLNKFNGYSIIVYKNNPEDEHSISSDNLSSICEDDTSLWVGTLGGGLNRFNKADKFEHYLHLADDTTTISDNVIYDILIDFKGNLWIATQNGLDRLNPNKEKFIHYLKNIPIISITEDNKGNLYLRSFDDFYILNVESSSVEQFSLDNSHDISELPSNILIDSYENVWIGTDRGLYMYDTSDKCIVPFSSTDKENKILNRVPITCLLEDNNKNIWIGTFRSGLHKYNRSCDKVYSYYNNPYDTKSLTHNSIVNIYQDKSELLWVATPEGGLNKLKLKSRNFNFYYHLPEAVGKTLTHNTVQSFYEDGQKRIWVGTDYNINIFDKKSGTFTEVPVPASKNYGGLISVLAFCKGPDESLWIGTRMLGLLIYDLKSRKFRDIRNSKQFPSLLKKAWIRNIIKDRDGDLWISSDKALFRYLSVQQKFIIYTKQNSPGLSDDFSIPLHEDSDGIIWIGTRNKGISRYDKQKNEFINFRHQYNNLTSLTNDYVVSINSDANYIWIGTLNGLNRLDRRDYSIKQYTEADGLPDECINGILIDDSGRLWMSTNFGISRFDPRTGIFRNFDVYDGLQDYKFKGLSAFKSSDGEMYFGGTKGFNSFYPEKVVDNNHIPLVVLTSFKVLYKEKKFDKDISQIKKIVLDYDENNIQFEFASLDFTIPIKNQYKYILEGFDEGWIDAGNKRSANYTNLDGGEYTFRVIGSNNDGYWNKEGVAVKVIIVPPLGQTLFFRITFILVLSIIIFSIFRRRIVNIEKRRKLLEKLNEQLSNEINERKETEKQLIHAKEEAEHANQLKSEFLAQISHEIRSPINIAFSYLSLIKEEMQNKLNPLLETSFNAIDTANDRVIRTVDLILNTSEMQLGIYKPHYVDLDLKRDIFEDIILQYQNKAKSKNLALRFSSENTNTIIRGDRYSVTQIFANLIDNAIKYTEKGSINVKIKRKNEKQLVITVNDTGIGISEEYLPHLFEEFSQEEQGYTRRFEGNGLGLSLVKKYCELNDADITVTSVKGEGTEFKVTFIT